MVAKNTQEDKDLRSFSPTIRKEENQFYVSQLLRATKLFNRSDNNIALEGGYGTGKSTIVKQLYGHIFWRLLNKPKTISFLSFLNDDESSKEDMGESTKDDSEKNNIAEIFTNEHSNKYSELLQREIVNQLYFGERPNKLKGSNYKRTGRTYLLLSVITAICSVAPLFPFIKQTAATTFYIFGNDDLKAFVLGLKPSASAVLFIVVSTVFALIMNTLLKKICNGEIKQISAKDITIEPDNSRPDFSQLIDLLIFYFRRTKRRVLIFEDIDRFNDMKIYEELRRLNFILNNSAHWLRKIKFIYALKGDLCVDVKNTDTNAEAKLFDLVIPVVPFISQANLDSLFKEECENVGLNNETVLSAANIIGKYTTDMRTIKMVINNILAYTNQYQGLNNTDYGNITALAIIRSLNPQGFQELYSFDGLMSALETDCSKAKEGALLKIEKDFSATAFVLKDAKTIFQEIKQWVQQNAKYQYSSPTAFELQGEKIGFNVDGVVKIFENISQTAKIIFNNGSTLPIDDQLKNDLFSSYIFRANSAENVSEKNNEIRKVVSTDVFSYFSQNMITKYSNTKTRKNLLADLIAGGYITEEYVRFLSKSSASMDEIAATKYIGTYIHGNGTDCRHVLLREGTVCYIINKLTPTDFMSTSLYNMSIFNYLIGEYLDNKSKEILDAILDYAKSNLDIFLDFFDEFCVGNKAILGMGDCYAISIEHINGYTKENPAAFLTNLIAKKYPSELLHKIAWSALKDTKAKEFIYNIAILSIEKPDTVKISADDAPFLNYYADSIAQNGGSEILYKLFIGNDINIKDLSILECIDNNTISDDIGDIKLEINEANLRWISDANMKEYLKTHKLNGSDEIEMLLHGTHRETIRYIAMYIDSVIAEENDITPGAYAIAANVLLHDKCNITYDTILRYVGHVPTDIIVDMINKSTLDSNEIITILSRMEDNNLSKVASGGKKIIKLKNTKRHRKLSNTLIKMGLVHHRNNNKDDNIHLMVSQ